MQLLLIGGRGSLPALTPQTADRDASGKLGHLALGPRLPYGIEVAP